MEENNSVVKNIFVELGFDLYGQVYPSKYVPEGEPWGYSKAQLAYVYSCTVVLGDYGNALRVDLKGLGTQFIPVSTASKLKVGDVVAPADVRFIKLVKADEVDPKKRTIIRVL